MSRRILIVEDDPTLRMGLSDAFGLEGYEVTVAADGALADRWLGERSFDVIILDVMLPGRGGLEILRRLRERGATTPVLLLTARSDENDKVLGLELGADDYVTKPFSIRELLARVKALLRRNERIVAVLESRAEVRRFSVGRITVDVLEFRLERDGEVIAITPKEAAMLALLHREGGRVVSRERFLREVWDGGLEVTHRTVDTHVLNLRRKLEDDPSRPRHLLTVHGAGYRLDAAPAP